jgi:hypothetical protein
MLIDNINYLRKHYRPIREYLKIHEAELIKEPIKVVTAKNGQPTLQVEVGNKKLFIHSKYNPAHEADQIVDGYKDEVENYDHIFFYGIGLGYVIEAFANRFPEKQFTLYEPNPTIFYRLSCEKKLEKLPTKNIKNIYMETSEQDRVNYLMDFTNQLNGNVLFIALPSYERIFKDETQKFFTQFKEHVKNKRSSIHTDLAFEKRWTINSMMNLQEVLKTPNILHDMDKTHFQNKSAIIVAAGPSLDEEIEHLKYIKDHGLAYIFSVGSAINTLIEYDIYPHAMCTYDPKIENQLVFKKLIDRGINSIPLIFGSSVGFETIQKYDGPKLHMITSQDTVSLHFLRHKSGVNIKTVNDASSIAVITLQLLCELGFKTIILVGQNFAFKGRLQYSDGIEHHPLQVNDDNLKNAFVVKDVEGNDVLTNDTYNNMRKQMEQYIKQYTAIEVINTTKGGANIEGTKYVPLKELIKHRLKSKIVDEKWLETSVETYDKLKLAEQARKILNDYKSFVKSVNAISQALYQLNRVIQSGKSDYGVDKFYKEVDFHFNKVKSNDYFRTIILPMNRVIFDILVKEIKNIHKEKNNFKKSEMILKFFGNFFLACRKDMELVEPLFFKLNLVIKEFCNDLQLEREIYELFGKEGKKHKKTNENNIPMQQVASLVSNITNNPDVIVKHNVNSLLVKQFNSNNEFTRYDIIVRYLAIGEYFGENKVGYQLYTKMQKERGQKVHNLNRFKTLLKSINENGFDEKSCITIDQNLKLVDGSHRLASALYFNEQNISVQFTFSQGEVDYTINWFKSHHFTKNEIDIILNAKTKIFKERNLYFVCILWPPVQDYFDEITKVLHYQYDIDAIYDTYISSNHDFNKIVKDIYEVDDIEGWKIEKKLQYMVGYPNKIRVILLQIGDPCFRKKNINSKAISQKVEEIKKLCRNKYKKKISNYFHDIIMHIGDNFDHSKHIMKVLNEYELKNVDLKEEVSELFSYSNELKSIMEIYDIKSSDFCIVGSSVLEYHGIRKAKDIDILLKPDVRRKFSNFERAFKLSKHVEVVGLNWGKPINIEDDELIDDSRYHIKYGEFNLIRLEVLYLIKKGRGREKDLSDLIKIEKDFLKKGKMDRFLLNSLTKDFKL